MPSNQTLIGALLWRHYGTFAVTSQLHSELKIIEMLQMRDCRATPVVLEASTLKAPLYRNYFE